MRHMAHAPRNPELLHWWRCMQHGGAPQPPPFGGRREQMSPEARERSFDELACGLASGTLSRAKALRLMGAALVGGVLASIPRVAVAATCSPSGCCECELADPETFQVVRKKCMLLSTTDCQGETGHLVNVCARRCRKFKERKYPNLLITQTSV